VRSFTTPDDYSLVDIICPGSDTGDLIAMTVLMMLLWAIEIVPLEDEAPTRQTQSLWML